jgi:hypothetical protein
MAGRRAYWSDGLAAWLRYAYGIAGLTVLLAPRAARWGRFWLRSRVGERLALARVAAATTTAA